MSARGSSSIRCEIIDIELTTSEFDVDQDGIRGCSIRLAKMLTEVVLCTHFTANSCHMPGTPLSSCSPRSSNSTPEPATRSFTIADTRIS